MAAGQSVQVTLGFKADTSGAKQAIQELNAQLNKIQANSLDNLGINRELQEASQAAKVLQQNLQAALDVKTGQINITTFAKNLTNAGTSVTQLGQKLMAAGTSGQMAFAQLGRSIAAMDVPLKQTNATLQNMMTTLKNTAKWELSSNLVHGIESAFSNALNYSKQLNQSLTDIRIVSGASADDMARFAVEANTAAKALGTTTKAYADAAKIYYQQGDSATQAAKKAEITLKATNAAFKANASEMSEMLTAVWNSFQVGADQLESYVDVMANLGAHTATSMEEIATAMQKVAATSNTVGVSMEQMSAMIATVSSATRLSAETIGTSMNTILSRIGGLKLGETLEDGVDLNKYSKALKSVGIDVLTASGQLRNMGAVIEELGNKWTTLSTAQQSALAQTIGGARQYTNLMALFSNWDKYQINLDFAINSDGALEKMQETFMQGWEGATAKMKASLEGIYQTLIDDQGMIDFTNSLAGILDSVNNIIQSFGGLEGVLTQLGAIGVQVFSKQIGEGIANSITKMTTFISSFQQLHLIDGKGWSDLGGWGKMQHAMTAIGMNTNERLYNQTTNQAASLLRDAKDTGDLGLNSQITASQILIDKKLELQSVENQLTESQKKQAQAGLAQLTAQVNEVDRLAQAYQETETNLRATNRSLTSYNALQEAATRGTSIKNNQFLQTTLQTDPTQIKQIYEQLSSKIMIRQSNVLSGGNLFGAFTKESLANVDSTLGTLVTRYENLNRAMTLVESQGSKFSESLRAMAKPGAQAAAELGVLTQSLNQTKDNMQQMGASTAVIEQWQAKLEAAAQKGPTEFTAALRTVTDEANQMGLKLQASANAALDILAGKLGLSRDALLQAGEQAGFSAEQMARLAQALGLVGSQADAIPMKVSKVVTSLQQITRMAGAMAGAFTSAFNTIANWDTSNLTSKVMGVTSTITQSMSAIGSGAMLGASVGVGPYGKAIGAGVGALVGLAGTIVGIVMGNAEKEAKAKAAQLNKDFKTQQEASSKTKEEITSAKDLITTYNTLYATYLKTGEGQSELLETALQIAEAYGIQGAAVLAMSGNFEKFNEVIRENLHYTDLLTAAETQAAESRGQMTNAAESLNAVIGGTIRNSEYGSYKLNDLNDIAAISSFNMPTDAWMNLPMTDPNVQAWMINMANLTGVAKDYYTGWNGKDSVAKLLVQAFMDNDKFDLSADILRRSSGYTGDWGSSGSGRWANFAAQNGGAISQIYTAFPDELSKITLGEFIQGSHYIDYQNGFGLPFLDLAPGLSGDWAASGLEDENSRLISSMPSAWFTAEPSEHYSTISGWFNENSPYAHLINDQGGIQVSLTDPYQLQADLELIATWDQEIGRLIEDTEEGSTERQLLTNLRAVLQKVKTTKIEDSDQTIEKYAAQAVEDANKWTEILTLQSSVTSMFGRNEKNTKFSDYTKYVGDLNHLVELNYKNMDEFEKFHDMDLTEIQADPTLLKEFNQLRDKAVTKTIQDTTGFTDYAQMYRMIINTFDTTQLPKVNQFIDEHELTSMSTTTASALKQLMDHGIDIVNEANSAIVNAILDADTSITDASESTLTKYQNAKSSLKKDMSQEESQKIYDTFFGEDKIAEDGTTWDQFIQMNYEARENWIDQMIEEARTSDRERYKQLKQNSEEARDIWGEQIVHDYSQEAFDLLTNNYDRLSAAYTQYSTSMLHYFDTTATGFKLKDNLDEELPSWVTDLLNGRTTIEASEFGNAFGGFLATQKDSFGNAIFTDNDIKLLTQGTYSFDQLMSAYAIWLSYDEEARNAQTLIDILDGTGEAAEGATDKVKRLVSAFKSLPTTNEDMTKLLALVNEYQWLRPGETVTNGGKYGLTTNTGRTIAHQAMTSQDLIGLYHSNRSEYEQLMINSIKYQIQTQGDEDGLLTEQLWQVEESHKATELTAELEPLNQELSTLKSHLSDLQSLDISSVPEEASQAWQKLANVLKDNGLETTYEQWASLSEKERYEKIYGENGLVVTNLKRQKEIAGQMASQTASYYQGDKNFDELYALDNHGIDQITDPTMLEHYKEYLEYKQQEAETDDEIAEAALKLEQVNEQIDATERANKEQSKLNKWNQELTEFNKAAEQAKTNYESLSQAIETGQLTNAQKGTLGDTLTEAWNKATTAAQRAKVAMTAAYESTAKQQEALDQQAAAIKKFGGTREDKTQAWDLNTLLAGKTWQTTVTADDQTQTTAAWKDEADFITKLFGDNLSNAETSVLSTAYKAAIQIVPEWATKPEEFMRAFYDQLESMGENYGEQQNALMQQLADNINNLYSNLGQQEQAAAAAAVQAWTNAFNQIKTIRQGLLSGGSAMELIAGSPEQAIAMWQQYAAYQAKNGKTATVQDLLTAAGSGQLSADMFTYGTAESYLSNARKQYGIDYTTWTDTTTGQTYYGNGANFDNSMRRAATALGMTYDANAGNVSWNAEKQAFNIEGKDETFTAAQLIEQAQTGNLSIGREAMTAYLTPFWSNALQQVTNETTGQNYTAQEATDLITAAMTKGQDSEEWDTLSTALGTVDGGLQAFATALQTATAASEALTRAQQHATEQERIAQKSTRISSALASYAENSQGMSWEQYAKMQGLTDAEIAEAGNVTAANARGLSYKQSRSAEAAYNSAAKKYREEAAALLVENGGQYTTDSIEYQNMIRAAEQQEQQAASERGKRMSDRQTRMSEIRARILRTREREAERLNTGAAASTMKNAYEDYYRTGVMSAEVQQALLKAGIDPSIITGRESYKSTMEQLKANNAQYMEMQKKNAALYARQQTGRSTINFDNVTSTTDYQTWLDSLSYVDRVWAENNSSMQTYFNNYRQSLIDAETAQAGLSTAAIEMGANIETATARATKETEKLTKKYEQLEGLSDSLTEKVQTGKINNTTRQKLVQAGLAQNWDAATTIAQRAKVIAQAQVQTATAQIDMLTRQNKGALEIDDFFNSENFNTDKLARTMPATKMAQAFKENFTTELQKTDGDINKAFDNILSMDAFNSFSDEAKAKMREIFSDISSTMDANASPTEYWEKFIQACSEAGDDAKETIASVTTELFDNWSSVMSSIVAEEQSAAQQVIAIWEAAFATIAALHEAAFSGKSLESGLNNVDDFIEAFLLSGATDYNEFNSWLQQRGTAAQSAVDQLTLPQTTAQEIATSISGLAAYANWTSANQLHDYSEGGTRTQAEAIEAFKSDVVSNLTSHWDNLDAETLAKLGITKKDDGSYERTVTREDGTTYKQTINAAQDLLDLFTDRDWQKAYAAAAGAGQAYYTKQMHQQSEQFMREQMTGGALPYQMTLSNGATANTLTELQAAYNRQWQEGDVELLTKAIQTPVNKWLAGQGEAFTQTELDRLKALGVTDTESARATKENYNADTALVNAAQVSVANAVINTDLVQLADGSYVDTNTSRGRELQEGEEAGLGEAEYTGDDGKRYAGRVITAESYETLSNELQTIKETADAATSALVPGFEDALNGIAERLGVTRSELGNYIEDLAALEGVTLDWMSLTADEQVMMGQAAEEWTKASDAITALSEALTEKTGAFAIIEDTTKSITEQRSAYETLRDAVNDYFRDQEVGIDFVKDNIDIIKKWAEGSTEAMEELEAKILEQQLTKMFEELGDTTKDAAKEAAKLNKIANGLKFGEKLSGTKGAIPSLIKLQKELGLTNKQMSELLDTMGVTSNWGEKAAQSANDFVKQFDDGSGDIAAALAMANEQLADLGMQVKQVGDDFVYCATSAEGVQIDASNLDTSTLEAISQAYAEQGIEIPVSYMVENPDAITAILNQDGTITYTVIPPAEPTMEEETGENSLNVSGSGQATVSLPGGGTQTAPTSVNLQGTGQTTISVPKFEGTGNRPGGGGGGKKPSGGGGGGGGSKKKKYEKKKRTDDSSDRYHEVTKQLDHMSNKLEKIDKIKSATWGKDHLKAINDEIAAIKEENQVQQEYLEEAQAYYNQHKQMLEAMGAQIDENGVVTNYEELMDQWTAEYNAAVEHYNSLTAEQQEKESSKAELNEAEETYNQRMQLLEELEEDASLLETIQNDILENQNKISAAIAEGITYKIEFQFDYDERELAALDQWIERYESKLAHQDDTWEKLKKKQDIYFTTDDKGRLNGGELYYLQEQYAELQRQYNDGKGDLNAADYAELLKDLEERIRDTVTNIEELRQQMSELYGSTIDLAKEELSKYTDQIDHMVSSAESLVELQGLMGHGDSASAVLGLYETQYKASEANLQQSRTWMETIRAQRDEIQAQYDAQVAALGDNATAEQLEEINQLYGPMLDKANEELMEAEDEFYENWQATAEKAQALFEKQVDAAIEKFDEAIGSFTGTDFDFDELESDYEYYTEVQERYVSTSKELYEVSKLNRQINQSISDATTKQSKERLKLLQQEINDMSEKNQLTEYDIEMMQLQYKHALALQELEEKQNAKSVVRLTRDENGNYGYQYTADESDINDARQKVEDALQDINELSANRVAELEQQWISSEREYRDKLKEIAADTSLTIEEREAKMAELTQQHQESMLFLQQQYGNASEALLTNQQHVQERYGQTILENTGMIQDQMNSLAGLALLSSGDYTAYLNEQLAEGGSLWQALHSHMDNLDSIATAAGTNWETATTGASNYVDTLNDLQTTLSQTNQTMATTTQNILDYVAAWTQSEGVMQTLLNDAEALAAAMRGEIGDENDDVQDTQVGAEGPSGTNQKHYMYAWGYRGWFGDQAGYDSSTAAKAAAYNDIEAFFENLKLTEDSEDADAAVINSKYQAYIAQAKKTVSVTKYAAGGLVDYTGPAWVDGTVTQPELMLNASDTQKILQAVDFVRMLDDGTLANIQAAIAQNTLSMLYTLGSINAPTTHYKPEELQQNVQISAEFPNATDHNEIAQAFDDLINLATQYAHRK